MMPLNADFLDRPDAARIAFLTEPGRDPAVVYLHGLGSTMRGEKAGCLFAWAAAKGHAALRFDYTGHGESGGRFEDGGIGRWRDDALDAIAAALPARRLILVGSSIGAWVALHVAQRLEERVAGFIGIAAAPDIVTHIVARFTPAQRDELARHGRVVQPTTWREPFVLTTTMLDEAMALRVLDATIPLACPVRLLHGQADTDVPWQLSCQMAAQIAGGDVRLTLVKDGDHRLSRPSDLALLQAMLDELTDQARPSTAAR